MHIVKIHLVDGRTLHLPIHIILGVIWKSATAGLVLLRDNREYQVENPDAVIAMLKNHNQFNTKPTIFEA